MPRTIGLMSGTSLDGVDAAWLDTDGITVTAFGPTLTVPYDAALRAELRIILDLAPALRPDDPRLLAATERLTDYQDEAYAASFLDQLAPIKSADKEPFTTLRETARYLALWMSYEDAIRVADLKIRGTRFARVREEARVEGSQVLHIHEYLHPGVQEIADIAPAGLGGFLLKTRWAHKLVRALVGNGRIVKTTSLGGYLQLYVLASLRPMRPRSLRFREENRNIAVWLARIPSLLREDHALALEYAECPRLIKGYGETYALGSRNFSAIMDALPHLRGSGDAAARLRALREAALADEQGSKLSTALKEELA